MDTGTLRSPTETLSPRRPVCVGLGTTVAEAIQLMVDKSIGCLCVVQDGRLRGILTERDVLTKVAGPRLDPKSLKVEEIMTPDPEYLISGDTVAFALNRMHVGGFRHVPLVDKAHRPTALISIKDIVSHLAASLEPAGP